MAGLSHKKKTKKKQKKREKSSNKEEIMNDDNFWNPMGDDANDSDDNFGNIDINQSNDKSGVALAVGKMSVLKNKDNINLNELKEEMRRLEIAYEMTAKQQIEVLIQAFVSWN